MTNKVKIIALSLCWGFSVAVYAALPEEEEFTSGSGMGGTGHADVPELIDVPDIPAPANIPEIPDVSIDLEGPGSMVDGVIESVDMPEGDAPQ